MPAIVLPTRDGSTTPRPDSRVATLPASRPGRALVDSLVEQQRAGLVRQDDPVILARFVWPVVHGVAMLVIDGQLGGVDERGEALNRYAVERLRDAISPSA